MVRSLLFVPGNQQRMLEKARTLPVDAVVLDLEDGVPAGEKDAARRLVGATAASSFAARVIVRLNGLEAAPWRPTSPRPWRAPPRPCCCPRWSALLMCRGWQSCCRRRSG